MVAAARSAGIAWVALTEHTRPGQLGPYGVIDGITVIPGFELSTAGASLLGLGLSALPDAPTKDPEALVRLVHAAGGVAFVGHFEHSRLADPEAYRRAAPDGVELVNLHANSEQRRGALTWRIPLLPSAVALRSLLFVPEANLTRWEALPGPPPIVGAVDAHAKFRLARPGAAARSTATATCSGCSRPTCSRATRAPPRSSKRCAAAAATSRSKGSGAWTRSASSRPAAASGWRRRRRRG